MSTERLWATVDGAVLAAVRAQVGPRGVSRFVNDALRHELERAQLAELVGQLHDEIDPPTDLCLRDTAAHGRDQGPPAWQSQ